MKKFERFAKIAMYILIPGVVVAVAAGVFCILALSRDITSKQAAIAFGLGCLGGLGVGLKRNFA